MTGRRPAAPPAVVAGLTLALLAACSGRDAGGGTPSSAPQAVVESARRAAEAVPKRPEGTWLPAAWPDACRLLVPASGFDLGASVPTPGTLGDGSPLPGAKSCRRTLLRTSAGIATSGGTEVTLTVHLVTEDVWSVWGGVQTLEGFVRPVESLGDEAFLTDVGFDDTPEKLWLCVGRTIVRVERTPGTLDRDDARTVLLALGGATEGVLRTLPAGQSPDPGWRPSAGATSP